MFYPDLSPMSVKWHLLQNNSSSATSRILNCSSAAAAISNLDLFGGHPHSQHFNGHHHHHHHHGGLHAHQRYNSHGNMNGSDKQFDQFGKSKKSFSNITLPAHFKYVWKDIKCFS